MGLFFLRDNNRNKAVQFFCAIPVGIDFLIIFVYCKKWKFFVYLHENEINLPTFLPVNWQEDQIMFLGGMKESPSLMMKHPEKVALFYLRLFCLFLTITEKRMVKFPKNWETFLKTGPKTSQRFQRDWSKIPKWCHCTNPTD